MAETLFEEILIIHCRGFKLLNKQDCRLAMSDFFRLLRILPKYRKKKIKMFIRRNMGQNKILETYLCKYIFNFEVMHRTIVYILGGLRFPLIRHNMFHKLFIRDYS